MPYLHIFGQKIEISSTLNFGKMQIFMHIKKALNLGPKMLYLGSFWQNLKKAVAIFEIRTF